MRGKGEAMNQQKLAALYDKYFAETKANKGKIITIDFELIDLISIIGQLQLALRHPGNHGPTRALAEQFINRVRDSLTEMPAIQEVITRGFDTNYDT